MRKLIALLCAGLLITGCASKPAATGTPDTGASTEKTVITLGYWGDSGETKVYENAIKGIESELPNVEVKLQHYPGTADFWNSLPGQIAAGTAPDIIAPTNEQHIGYIDSGLFLPLDEYGLDMSAFKTNAIDAWTYNGKLYGIPMTASPAIFVVNKTMWKDAGLAEYPKTWAEVRMAAEKLTTPDVKGLVIDVSQGYHVTQYMNSFGGGWKNGAEISSDANTEALNYVFDMYRDGYAINPKDLAFGWDAEVFAANKAAMSTGGTWYIGFMKDAAPDIDYEILPIPSKDGTGSGTLHSIAFTVLKDSKSPEIAAKVAYYLSREDAQKDYSTIVGGVPARASLDDFYFDANPAMAPLRESAMKATSFGYPIDSGKFQDSLVKEFEEVVYQNKLKYTPTTSKEILDRLATEFGN